MSEKEAYQLTSDLLLTLVKKYVEEGEHTVVTVDYDTIVALDKVLAMCAEQLGIDNIPIVLDVPKPDWL